MEKRAVLIVAALVAVCLVLLFRGGSVGGSYKDKERQVEMRLQTEAHK